jgi:hypothetical protein
MPAVVASVGRSRRRGCSDIMGVLRDLRIRISLRGRAAGSSTLVAALAVLACVLPSTNAGAVEWTKHWTVGVRLGELVPVDAQRGGFRLFGGDFRNSNTDDRKVSIEKLPYGTLILGHGIKKFKKVSMSLELQVSRMTSKVGDETVYNDRDASTRVSLPPDNLLRQNGDETFETRSLGKLTMTPIFGNLLFHWAAKNNPDRSDFYVGGGAGLVLGTFAESDEYRQFVRDFDGNDDVKAGNAFGILLKMGANVRLSKDKNWFMFFEGEFISTEFTTKKAQVAWPGVDFTAGTQDVDMDGNGSLETTVDSDLRIVDPGNIRYDSATIGLGVRYRFGGKKAAAELAKPVTAPETTEPAQPH